MNDTLEEIDEEIITDELSVWDKTKAFLVVHYRGLVCFVTPIIMTVILLDPFPPAKYQWCAYTLAVMAMYWLSECIPLEITSFIPVIIFPLTEVMTATDICKCYMNDIVILLIGSLLLAFALEQSGLLKRLIYACLPAGINSQIAMFVVVYEITLLMSAFIPNTTAIKIMIPIILDVLEVFEKNGALKLYETNENGEKVASDLTTGYFCGITYAATIGGLMTIIGTATNFAFKGINQKMSAVSEDQLPFLQFMMASFVPAFFSAQFSLAYMILVFFGVFGDKSEASKKAGNLASAGNAVKESIKVEANKLGSFTMREGVVAAFFFIAIAAYTFRNPIYFSGINYYHGQYFNLTDVAFIQDSALAFIMCFLLFMLPATTNFTENFTAKIHEELPEGSCPSLLNWATANSVIPFSFIFILGGGFALVDASQSSGLNIQIAMFFGFMRDVPSEVGILLVMLFTTILTNIASNVVVANLMCPMAMLLAWQMSASQLWFCMAAGYAASFAFLLPVGCPGNFIVYNVVNIPLLKMIIAGIGPTIITFAVFYLYIIFGFPLYV